MNCYNDLNLLMHLIMNKEICPNHSTVYNLIHIHIQKEIQPKAEIILIFNYCFEIHNSDFESSFQEFKYIYLIALNS